MSLQLALAFGIISTFDIIQEQPYLLQRDQPLLDT